MKKLETSIKKFALENAYLHKGTANEKAVLGKLLASKEITKSEIKTTSKIIKKIVDEINSMTKEEQELKIKREFPNLLHREKKEKELAELPNAVMNKVVTRMPPGPSNFMTAGHAISFLINYMYSKKYDGKCILRIDDTNPEKDKAEFVNSFLDGIKYLRIKPSKTVYTSDDIEKMYSQINKLIKENKVYVCFCNQEKISKLRTKKESCECSKAKEKETLKLWNKMLNGDFKEKECTLRLRGDMKSKNAVMRDPSIFRINYSEHYRQRKKYIVWPLYDFASTCEEEWTGVTHILRSIEFGNERIELQKYLSKLMGFKEKTYIQYGRFNVAGLEKTSGRHLRELVTKGKYTWDHPSFPTLAALKRRGFKPETFYELAKKVGLSKTPTPIDDSLLSSINRKFLDAECNRYFFVAKPFVKITLDNNFKKVSVLPLHPNKKETRKIKATNKIFITKSDFEKNKGKEIRLKDLTNIMLTKKAKITDNNIKHSIQKIHWISEENIPAEVLMTNGKKIKGLCEPNCVQIKVGEIVQFERFGFARLEKKTKNKLEFIFTHK